jgi:hypothetical protein
MYTLEEQFKKECKKEIEEIHLTRLMGGGADFREKDLYIKWLEKEIKVLKETMKKGSWESYQDLLHETSTAWAKVERLEKELMQKTLDNEGLQINNYALEKENKALLRCYHCYKSCVGCKYIDDLPKDADGKIKEVE